MSSGATPESTDRGLSTPPSAWSLVGLPGPVPAAAYLTGPLATQYRLVVDVLQDQRSVTLTGVSFDEVSTLVRERLADAGAPELKDDLALEARLAQLVEWGTCTAWQDEATTQEDFLRNRYRYQLSDAGYHLNAAVRTVEAEQDATSSAVLLAPLTLLHRLTATVAALDAGDTSMASEELSQVQTTLHTMAETATRWQNHLASALGGAPTEAKVTRLLETILRYAEIWGVGVDAWSQPIAAHVPRLRALEDEQWRAMARARLGPSVTEEHLDGPMREMRADVATLDAWFGGADSQAARLRRQIRNAVAPVLRGHRALLAIGGTVSRKADLLRLAGAIEQAANDDDAWRIWCTATGLYSARHVSDTVPEDSGGQHRSVWDADPVPVSRRLRAQGRKALAGRAPHVVDRRAARERARRAAAQERADLERAATALAARSGTALSEWGSLTRPEAELLLELVSAARRYRGGRTTGAHPQEAVSADGRWTLRLTPRAGSAVITSPGGRIVLPDAVVEVTS